MWRWQLRCTPVARSCVAHPEPYRRSRCDSCHARARLAPMRSGWVVRAPASSANLGAAFDAVAVALALPLEVTDDDEHPAPETHPAVRAFRLAGGSGSLTVRTRIPGGRGLGFSGAARVAGLLAAHVQRGNM